MIGVIDGGLSVKYRDLSHKRDLTLVIGAFLGLRNFTLKLCVYLGGEYS